MVGEQLKLPAIPDTPGATCQTPANCCASGYGRGLISTPLTTLKIAVLAPMPSASVTRATEVNIGALPSRRKTCRRDVMESYTRAARTWFSHTFGFFHSACFGLTSGRPGPPNVFHARLRALNWSRERHHGGHRRTDQPVRPPRQYRIESAVRAGRDDRPRARRQTDDPHGARNHQRRDG